MNTLHPLLQIQDALADAQVLGRDLQQLVVGEELQALLQAHLLGRDQAQRVVTSRQARVLVSCLLLADVDGDVLRSWGSTPTTMPSYTGVRRRR